MKLKLDKMTSRELADWFGISYNTYRKSANSRKKYLNELAFYCDFKEVHGGVIVKKIYIEEYNKDLKILQTKTYLKSLCKHNNLISLSGLEKETSLSYYHSSKIRNELFGDKPCNIDPKAHGLLGSRKMIWAIKLGNNKYRKLTTEEDELFNALITQAYNDDTVPAQVRAQQLILDYCAKEGMSAQEYKDILDDKGLNFFNDIVLRFRTITGYQLGKPTEHFIDELDEKVDDEYKRYLLEEINKINSKK